jgi:hypothetical protein
MYQICCGVILLAFGFFWLRIKKNDEIHLGPSNLSLLISFFGGGIVFILIGLLIIFGK